MAIIEMELAVKSRSPFLRRLERRDNIVPPTTSYVEVTDEMKTVDSSRMHFFFVEHEGVVLLKPFENSELYHGSEDARNKGKVEVRDSSNKKIKKGALILLSEDNREVKVLYRKAAEVHTIRLSTREAGEPLEANPIGVKPQDGDPTLIASVALEQPK